MKPSNPTTTKPDDPSANERALREAFKELHNRFHGRFQTHAEVAKRARWTNQELENVQIEDEEIYYGELLALFAKAQATDRAVAVIEGRIDELDKVPYHMTTVTSNYLPRRITELNLEKAKLEAERLALLSGEGES